MRQRAFLTLSRARMFQSSPGLEAGCDGSRTFTSTTGATLFQSSPGLEAGCDGHSGVGRHEYGSVSILTRLGGRVRRGAGTRIICVEG